MWDRSVCAASLPGSLDILLYAKLQCFNVVSISFLEAFPRRKPPSRDPKHGPDEFQEIRWNDLGCPHTA